MQTPDKQVNHIPSKEELEAEYLTLLKRYGNKTTEIKNLKKGVIGSVLDEQVDFTTREKDQERNAIHNELKRIGTQINRNKNDIDIDILRQQGSLEDYGLPEFIILTREDLTTSAYKFNGLNVENGKITTTHDKMLGHPDPFTEYANFPKDMVIMVFMVSPIFVSSDYDSGFYFNPKDFAMRQERAFKLATHFGFKEFIGADYKYFHDSSMLVLGVEVPKAKLKEVSDYIRDNPNEYRLGNEFYSEEEKLKVEETHNNELNTDIERMREIDPEDVEEYLNRRREYFGEE